MGDIVDIRKYTFTALPNGQLLEKPVMIYSGHLSGRIWKIRLEKEFWIALEMIAGKERKSLSDLFTNIYKSKQKKVPLTSAIKVFVITYLLFDKAQSEEAAEIINFISNEENGYKIVNKKIAANYRRF